MGFNHPIPQPKKKNHILALEYFVATLFVEGEDEEAAAAWKQVEGEDVYSEEVARRLFCIEKALRATGHRGWEVYEVYQSRRYTLRLKASLEAVVAKEIQRRELDRREHQRERAKQQKTLELLGRPDPSSESYVNDCISAEAARVNSQFPSDEIIGRRLDWLDEEFYVGLAENTVNWFVALWGFLFLVDCHFARQNGWNGEGRLPRPHRKKKLWVLVRKLRDAVWKLLQDKKPLGFDVRKPNIDFYRFVLDRNPRFLAGVIEYIEQSCAGLKRFVPMAVEELSKRGSEAASLLESDEDSTPPSDAAIDATPATPAESAPVADNTPQDEATAESDQAQAPAADAPTTEAVPAKPEPPAQPERTGAAVSLSGMLALTGPAQKDN